ncbi:MAG: hypothetical protein BRC49_05590 [Cyanobacteria bacterium SW_10_48_33]|nr:MAG: hypothetical protein BRC45_13980 [Cyanobacteria bacterium QS_5_48_63]PSO83911.1 MAG: hypothetical protein BRC43_17055 [Cyanobacteria bacterium QS_3_48_167]PSP12358.1 MAG: hypothetical protein BRC49_05590 [Cyanobacteria bacterium SW_10_48_33]
MLRSILAGSVALILLVSGSLPALAQTQQTAPQFQQQEAPQIEISQEELQQFAGVVEKLQGIQEESFQGMSEAIQDEGLTTKQFSAILQSQQNPDSEQTTKAGEQELQQFEQARARLAEIQKETQSQMQEVVEDEGLEVQRFNQILAAIRNNPELQQQIQQIIQN